MELEKSTKMASAGKPQAVTTADFMSGLRGSSSNSANSVTQSEEQPKTEQSQSEQSPTPSTAVAEVVETVETQVQPENLEAQPTEAELSDEKLKELYEKRFKTTEQVQETEEQKEKREKDFEKRMLDLYANQGGKIEDFVVIKEVANMDLAQLSKNELVNELKSGGFGEDEIQEMLVERYYQMNPDEVEQGFEESDEDYEKRKEKIRKKVAYGTEKLTKRSAYQQEKAKSILDSLRKAIEISDLEVKKESEYAAKVENLSKELPRKLTFQLGKLDNVDIAPIEYDVTDEDVANVVTQLKDRAIEKQLFNDEGELNVDEVAKIVLRNSILEKVAREALFEGQTRQVKEVEKVFPATSPNELGVGGTPSPSKNGQKGKLASFGKPVLARKGAPVR